MARVTITNNQTNSYSVPSPIGKLLAAGETRVFDNIPITDLERSLSFQAAASAGTITVVVGEDPNVPDTWETGSQSVTPVSDNTISTAKIVNGAVTDTKIGALAVTAAKLASDAVTTVKILNDAVTTAKILNDAVTSAKINLFLSAVTAATGAAQNIAHSLGAVPSTVLVVPMRGHDGAGAAGDLFPVISEGAHDGTNVVVTCTVGASFRILALA